MLDSDLKVDIKTNGDSNRGIYYGDSQRLILYINKHESLDDFLKTINHELIHHCINICEEEIDEDQEEHLIFMMNWADEELVD